MKIFACCWVLLAGLSLLGSNLVPDPEFDNSLKSARVDMHPGNFKITRITEDRTWNKACRIEYVKPYKKAGQPDRCFLTIMWSAEKDGGVKVKPNTRYRFSMAVKGTVPQKSCYVQVIEWTADGFWKGRRRLGIANSGNLIKFTAQIDTYQTIRGEFRTGSGARRASFGLTIRGTDKDKNMPNIGDYLIVDKISIEEISNLPPAVQAPAIVAVPKAVNLINDGDFEKSIKCLRSDMLPGNFKLSHDKAQKACRIEYIQPKKAAGKPDTCYLAVVCGNEKDGGVKVKPDTRYRFSMTYRGTMPGKSCYVQAEQWSKSGFWNGRKRLNFTDKTNIIRLSPLPDKLQSISGEFITGSDAKRAAFGITFRGNSKDKNLPPVGSYMLIEKVVIEEVLPSKNTSRRLIEFDGGFQSGFSDLRTSQPVAEQNAVSVSGTADALVVTVRGKHSERADLRKNDMMEVIFDPSLRGGDIYHFLVSAGGKKSQTGAAAGAGGSWQVKVSELPDNSFQSVFTIPYRVLGLNAANVKKGVLLGFNAAVYLSQGGVFMSWNRIHREFANPDFFGRILSSRALIASEIASLRKKCSNNAQFLAQLDAVSRLNDVSKQLDELQNIEQALARKIAGNSVFFLTAALPTTSPEVPVLPNYNAIKKEIKVTLAGNELRPEVLHLTNYTKNFEEYRISLFSPGPANGENPLGGTGNIAGTAAWGLKSSDGKVFPAGQIQLLRGVQVKDSEGEKHGLCLDPLVEAPNGIYSVPAGMTGMVWINFDSRNVLPGIYKGVLRIVPLSQNLTSINNSKLQYLGRWQDIPVTVEVLDFKLSEDPAIPLGVFSAPANEKMFVEMIKLGARDIHFEPWQFVISYNDDGSIKNFNTARADRNLQKILQWMDKYKVRDKCRISVCYSFYPHFLNRWVAGKFKLDSPQWQRAWKESLLAVDGFFRKYNIASDRYYLELWDEPPPARFEELLTAAAAAKKFAPQVRLMVTFDARRLPVEKLSKLRKKVDIWNFWSKGYFSGAYAGLIEDLRRDGSEIAYYTCSTALRLNLNDYYRMHGHWSYAQKLNMTSIYQFIDAPHNFTGIANWRRVSAGGMAYMAGENVVSSIRLECFRLGHTDIKYFKLLEELLAADPRHPAAAEAGEFLNKEILNTALRHPFDTQRPEDMRQKCIKLIHQFKEKK